MGKVWGKRDTIQQHLTQTLEWSFAKVASLLRQHRQFRFRSREPLRVVVWIYGILIMCILTKRRDLFDTFLKDICIPA
jgi:hypothetical protein